MRRKFFYVGCLLFLMLALSGCFHGRDDVNDNDTPNGEGNGDDSKEVIVRHFEFRSQGDIDGVLSTLTDRWDEASVSRMVEGIVKAEILEIDEEAREDIRNGYLINGMGSVNGTTGENLKVYRVKFEITYKEENEDAEDSGMNTWWYYVIRSDSNSPWLIDDFGL